MENEQYIESGLSVGTTKIANKYEIFTEEEVDIINNKIPELDERVGVIEYEIEDINSSLDSKANQTDLIIERNRIDNLVKLPEGSTTGDAELIDGRIGADGEVYTNIGSAIRTQISNITDKVETLEGNITPAFIQGGFIRDGGFLKDSRYETTDYILVPQGTTITIDNFTASDSDTGIDIISLYDANTENYIKCIKKGEGYGTLIKGTFMIESSCLIRISRFIDTRIKKCEITIDNYNTQKAILALENNIKTAENNINNKINNDLLICLNDRVIDDTHPYYNADNVPVGKIIGYGGSGINVPSISGTLMCFEGSSINGRCQMFVDRNGVLYNRARWNNVWSNWVSTETTLTKSMLETFRCLLPMGRTTADMSCDTLPVNSVYLVVTSITNLPDSETMGTIVTLSGERKANASGVIQIFINPKGNLYIRMNWSNTWRSWTHINKPVDTSNTLITDRDYYASFSLFETIGVVGDSYASGASGESEDDTVAYDHPEVSLPQILGRRNGVSVTNYAQGGMSTRSFLSNTKFGMAKLLSDPARGLYILALIRNDYNIENRGETGYIGSISDITNNSLDNYPDTFFGNYATIIEKIKTHAPYSKIVLMTGDYKTNNILGTAYNSATQEIAEHYNLPIMIQLDEPFFSSDYYRKDWASGGHPSAIIYSGMELAIERMFNKCINEYKNYFTYYRGISGNNGDSSIDG